MLVGARVKLSGKSVCSNMRIGRLYLKGVSHMRLQFSSSTPSALPECFSMVTGSPWVRPGVSIGILQPERTHKDPRV